MILKKIVGFAALFCTLAYATEQPWKEGWVKAKAFEVKYNSSNIIHDFNDVHKDMAKLEKGITTKAEKKEEDTNYTILRFSILDANKNIMDGKEKGIKLVNLDETTFDEREIIFFSGTGRPVDKKTQVSGERKLYVEITCNYDEAQKKLNEGHDKTLTNKIKRITKESKAATQQLKDFDKQVYSTKIKRVENVIKLLSIQEDKDSIKKALDDWKKDRTGLRISAVENNRLNMFELSNRLKERFEEGEKSSITPKLIELLPINDIKKLDECKKGMSHFYLDGLSKLQNNEFDLSDLTQGINDRWDGQVGKVKDDVAEKISELKTIYQHSEQTCLLYLSDPNIIEKHFMKFIRDIKVEDISSPLTLVFHLHTRRNLCMNCAISLCRELERNKGIFSKITKKVDDYIQENAASLLGAEIGNLEKKLGKPKDDEKEKVTISIHQFTLISEIWKMISEIKEEQWQLVGLEREKLKCMTNAILSLQEEDLKLFVPKIKKFHTLLTKKTQRVLLVSFREVSKNDKRGTGDFENIRQYKDMLPVDLTTLPLNLKKPIFAQMQINS